MDEFSEQSYAEKVCAVIVTYNCGAGISSTISALLPQVKLIIIIDNGSDADSIEIIVKAIGAPQVRLIECGSNYGIAHALNIGAKMAGNLGFEWLLTMDQDSVAESDMVAKMLRCASSSHNAAVLCPNIKIYPSGGETNVAPGCKELAAVITSGNLIKLEVLDKIGYYAESYFIDSVDFEFCLRIRKNGFRIVRANDATLSHHLGEVKTKMFFFFHYNLRYHPPLRRYYIVRNHLYLIREYAFQFPVFLSWKTLNLLLLILKIILVEDEKLQNMAMIRRGVWHFLIGRRGQI